MTDIATFMTESERVASMGAAVSLLFGIGTRFFRQISFGLGSYGRRRTQRIAEILTTIQGSTDPVHKIGSNALDEHRLLELNGMRASVIVRDELLKALTTGKVTTRDLRSASTYMRVP